MKGTMKSIIPIPKTSSCLCKKTIKKKAIVIIKRAIEAISCCTFLFLNLNIANIESPAEKNTNKRASAKCSFNK